MKCTSLIFALETWTLVTLFLARVYAFLPYSMGQMKSHPSNWLASLPELSSITGDSMSDMDEKKIASQFLSSFETAWRKESGKEVVKDFFVDDTSPPFWRDMVAFTWNIQTQEGSMEISEALEDDGVSSYRVKSHFALSHKPLLPRLFTENDNDVLEFWSDLTLDSIGTGKAHFRLIRETVKSDLATQSLTQTRHTDGEARNFKVHTLLTTLLELSDRPFRVGSNRIRGHEHGYFPNRKYWSERLLQEEDPFVLIVGGGQAGLALGARLHLLQIPYLIVESGPQPGTAWRKRYPSLYLHDPCWYNHMPYLPFPECWPVFCPRDKIADWLEFYAKSLDLNIKTDVRVRKVFKSKEGDNSWQVQVQERDSDNKEKTKTRTMSAKHVVFATGNSSKPKVPKNIPGTFMGLQLHSSQYRGGRLFANKKVVVVGSNNSGWDIVQDLWEQGAECVTMIQRSPSMVVSTESVLTHGLGSLYFQDAPLSHEDADLVATSVPYKLLLPKWKIINQQMKKRDQDLLKNLEEAGYQLEDGPDGAGIFAKSATEGGGFYIDMGCAELIIRKLVHVRYATISRLESDGIMIRDKKTGDEEYLRADVIIYATGFETMDKWVAKLCGEDISSKVGHTWGLGLGKRPKDPGPWEGELRNMWKPTAVDGLWFHGGNLAQSRHYSRFLALQLAARYLGILNIMDDDLQATASPINKRPTSMAD